MTTNIVSNILLINSFILERTSLSLFSDFEKLPSVLMAERYEVSIILGNAYGLFARFYTVDSMLDGM